MDFCSAVVPFHAVEKPKSFRRSIVYCGMCSMHALASFHSITTDLCLKLVYAAERLLYRTLFEASVDKRIVNRHFREPHERAFGEQRKNAWQPNRKHF